MAFVCREQELWFANQTEKEKVDYHRNMFFFLVESISLFVIMIVAIVANISTMAAILRVRSLRRNLNNILVLNLIFVDLSTTLGSMPFSFADIFEQGYLICFPTLCRVHGLFAHLGCFGNFSAITLISLFRCVKILARNRINVGRRHVAVLLACGWLYAAITVLPPVTGLVSGHVYTHGTHHCSPSWKDACWFFSLCLSCIYCITIPTMIVCYFLIRREVAKSAESVEGFSKPAAKKKPDMNNRDKGFWKYVSKSTKDSRTDCNTSFDGDESSQIEQIQDSAIYEGDFCEGQGDVQINNSTDVSSSAKQFVLQPPDVGVKIDPDHGLNTNTPSSNNPVTPLPDRNIQEEGKLTNISTPQFVSRDSVVSVDQSKCTDHIANTIGRDECVSKGNWLMKHRSDCSGDSVEISELTSVSGTEFSSDPSPCSRSDEDGSTDGLRRRKSKEVNITGSKVVRTVSERVHADDVSSVRNGDNGRRRGRWKRTKRSLTGDTISKTRRRNVDRKVTIAGMLLVLTTTVCWTPYFIVHSCHFHFDPSHAVDIFTMWLAYMNSALDPIIYAMLSKKIRLEIHRQFCMLIKR